ncbi:MAG: VWA domain-containing protein [Phycisphaerales bacterium]
MNQTGAASGSGSNAGAQGSGSGGGAGVEAPAAEGSDQRQSSGSQAASESESSGSSSEQGEEGDGSADDSGSGGETASQGSGAKTEAGGAGSGGGVGEQGRVEQSSSDHVQPETGSGGTQGGSNSTPGAPPTWIEPTAMEGSEAGGASGGAGGAGSGEARANDPASTSGSGGAEAGGLGEGRATATNEPAAPSGSLGVAQTADVAESADERDFLDAPLEVRDFPLEPSTTPEDPSTSPPDSSIETPSDVTSPESDDAAPVESTGSVDPRGPTSLAHEADDSGSEGSLEAAPARKQDASDSPKSPADDEPAPTDRSRQGLAGESDQVRDATARQDSGASPASNDAADSSTRSGPGTTIGDESDTESKVEESESGSPRASRIRIEIPQIDVEPIEARSLRDRSEHTLPDDPRWVLRGAWEQTNVRMNDADFAPGGYDRNLISIDPEEGLLRTYRVYGDGAYVAAGEFRVEIMPTGTLELRVDERRPHLFAAEPFTISGETVTPPSEPIERPRQWSLRDGVLEIEGRRFVRLERQAFEAVARGDASDAGGIAADGGWEISPTSRVEDDPAPAVDFFGTSIVGRHICFVVDVSGSMAGPRLAAALGELARSIESLPSDRFFYVLFFSGSKLVLEDRWLRATPSSKRTFKSKLVGIEAQGGTEPSAALQHAFSSLAPVPDEIHFMTDGLIPQGIPELLRNLNAGRVRTVIHTYAFGERASEVMLEAIASEHGGRYRFVPE